MPAAEGAPAAALLLTEEGFIAVAVVIFCLLCEEPLMTESLQRGQAGAQLRSLRQVLTQLSYALGFEMKQLPSVDNNGSRFWLVLQLVGGWVLREKSGDDERSRGAANAV